MEVLAFNPSLWLQRQRQVDLVKFKDSVVNVANSRPGRATQ